MEKVVRSVDYAFVLFIKAHVSNAYSTKKFASNSKTGVAPYRCHGANQNC